MKTRPFSPRVLRSAVLMASVLSLAACQEDTAKSTLASSVEVTPPPPALAIPVILNNTAVLVDENGKLLIPVESEYQPRIAGDYQNTVWAVKNNAWYLISKDASKVIKADFSGEPLGDLIPGFSWFLNGEKYGIVDAQGNIVQPPQYDEIYSGGDEEFIVYTINEKFGILNAQGELVTQALYDEVDLGSLARNAGLIVGKRGNESWVINTKTKAQTKVPYADLKGVENGYIKISTPDGKWGFADLEGKEVIAPQWPTLKVNPALNVVFAYEQWQNDGGDTFPVLRAAYTLTGKPVFSVKSTECGAEQLLDSQGKVVWPQDATPFCPKEE